MSIPEESGSLRKDTDLGRRGFLVMVGSTLVGRFLIPGEASCAPQATVATPTISGPTNSLPIPSPPTSKAGEAVRKIILPPTWGEDRDMLVFVEDGDDGEPRIMFWKLDTDEERAEAERFDAIINWRSWRTEEELRALLAKEPTWCIRWNMFGSFKLLSTNDTAILYGPDGPDIFTFDPAEAALFSADEAYDVILRMGQDLDNGDFWHFEPVQQADGLKDFRGDLEGWKQ